LDTEYDMSSKAMVLRNEIEKSLVDFDSDGDGGISAEFALPGKDSALFAGHFPGEAVLPGVCLIQCVLEALSKVEGNKVSLVSIAKARFSSVVFPGEKVRLSGNASWNGDVVAGKFVLSKCPEGDNSLKKVASVVLSAKNLND